jgi:hypothetical protein
MAKASLSILMALFLLTASLGVAAKAEDCNCAQTPRVSIHGIGDTMVRNAATPEAQDIGVADTSHAKEMILPIAEKLLAAVALRSWDKAEQALSILAYNLFGQMQCDETGESINPISNHPVPPDPKQDHKVNHDYPFRYDWRLDPMENARELNDYIQQVKEVTGHKTVDLIAFSEGGLVMIAYLAQFDSVDIDQIITVMSAHNGLTLVGKLFNKQLNVGGDLAAEYIRRYVGEDSGPMSLLSAAMDVLEQAGLMRQVEKAVEILIKNVTDQLFEDTLLPLFGQWPALWGFVSEEYYDSAKKTMLHDTVKYAALIKTIDNFHNNAQVKADALLQQAAKDGTKVSMIAAYGFPTQPFTEDNLSYAADGLIDTARESSGATCAPHGAFLPQDYQQAVADGHNHVSPDWKVDASTCLFPEQTWFLKNQVHFTWSFDGFIDFLVTSRNQPTVWDNAAYPQFMTRLQDKSFVPTQPEPSSVAVTLGGAIWNFATRVVQVILQQIKSDN